MIVARRRPSLPSSAMASAFSVFHGAASNTSGAPNGPAGPNAPNGPSSAHFTVTALSRWSILTKQLPPIDKIRSLHVYDFDNTRTLSLPHQASSTSC